MTIQRRLKIAVIVLAIIFFIGVAGFKLLGGHEWSTLDAVYMTVITMATVGYGETKDLSKNPAARIFAIFFILTGMGILLFVISSATAFIVEGELTQVLWRKKMIKEISKLKNHVIICGAGETGIHTVEELLKTRNDFVVIEPDKERVEKLKLLGDLNIIEGDANEDSVLIQAGIERAKGIIIALPTDKDNLFVTITARQLNPGIKIVAKGIDPKTDTKLIKAGANSVVSPNFIGGLRMVSEMIRPTVVNFLDLMLRDKLRTLRVDEVTISERSHIAGKTLEEAAITEKINLLVMALKEPDSPDFNFNPSPKTLLRPGQVLIVSGDIADVIKLREIA